MTAPTWIPFEVLIANTLLVEAAVAFAIYWFIVRRAENKRRARFLFVIGALLVVAFEGMGALDVLGAPKLHERVLSRGPLNATFCWETSVVLAGRRRTGPWRSITLRVAASARPSSSSATDSSRTSCGGSTMPRTPRRARHSSSRR